MLTLTLLPPQLRRRVDSAPPSRHRAASPTASRSQVRHEPKRGLVRQGTGRFARGRSASTGAKSAGLVVEARAVAKKAPVEPEVSRAHVAELEAANMAHLETIENLRKHIAFQQSAFDAQVREIEATYKRKVNDLLRSKSALLKDTEVRSSGSALSERGAPWGVGYSVLAVHSKHP